MNTREKISIAEGLVQAQGLVRQPGKQSTKPNFSARLKALRKRLGLSQQQFADRFGLPIATIRNWEQGRRQNVGSAAELLIAMIERDPEGMTEQAEAVFDAEEAETAVDF